MEDALLVLPRDTLALIDDLDLDAAVPRSRAKNSNRAATAKLDRVRQQVEQNLTHAPRIGDDSDRRVALGFQRERRAVFVGKRTDGDEQILDQPGEVDGLQSKVDPAGFDLRATEHVVHQFEQM